MKRRDNGYGNNRTELWKRQGKNLLLVREPALLAVLAGAILRELMAQVLVLLRALLSVLLLVSIGLLPRGGLLRAKREGKS